MKQYYKAVVILIFYITCMVVAPQVSYANEVPSKADVGFSYYIKRPANQNNDAGYFDLRMEPNQKQMVEIELYNDSDQDMVINLAVNSAKTNSNGVVEYGPTELKNDSSLKYDIKDIVKIPEKTTIPAKGQVNVPVEIAMPSEKYDGYVSGGIYMQKEETKEEKEANEKAKGVVNKYSFLVGVLLSETDQKVQPELKLNKISAGLTNYRNAIVVNFSNTEMEYLEAMSVDAQIFKKGSDEVIYESKKANYRMAPTSYINFPVNLNGEAIEAGNYVGHVLVTSGDKKWEWKEDFTITQEEADKYNSQDVSLIQERGINWKLIAVIVGGVLVVFIGLFVLVRVLSKKKKKKKKKSKKKK
ncbi:DUF916 and DUF3324 domain-containing protein [Enterococcus ureasiticus]|uniref:Uncharacterized protein n=1 Tax=Enterococcus ureasiticus TaxID=903984 RepID=A0A1E5GBU4_9ENTE|nr:DUF916 and DUF3324 domain-containing protein [Enterococcus ureasiticus]OEG09720.1 hypothetical protein BCR21_15385 [Enterococcus ureasiticus]